MLRFLGTIKIFLQNLTFFIKPLSVLRVFLIIEKLLKTSSHGWAVMDFREGPERSQ